MASGGAEGKLRLHAALSRSLNLYNQRPTWLDLAHKQLDQAVFAAYGWPATLNDEEILARLLALNLARAGQTALPHIPHKGTR